MNWHRFVCWWRGHDWKDIAISYEDYDDPTAIVATCQRCGEDRFLHEPKSWRMRS